ncbi:hypothetical protein ACU4GD_32540 [Cupriavidus basilensis]
MVLVCGGNGKVGQATIQIATALGARVFAVEREASPVVAATPAARRVHDGRQPRQYRRMVREEHDGHGADIVYNTVGGPYFQAEANQGHGVSAPRQIFISTVRSRRLLRHLCQLSRPSILMRASATLAMDSIACAAVFDRLAPMFAAGQLKPCPVHRRLCLPAGAPPMPIARRRRHGRAGTRGGDLRHRTRPASRQRRRISRPGHGMGAPLPALAGARGWARRESLSGSAFR